MNDRGKAANGDPAVTSPEKRGPYANERLVGVDVFKALAIIAVIAIHTTPFRRPTGSVAYSYLYILITEAARFAVPLFFILSGYFFARRIRAGIPPLLAATVALKRIGVAWLFFCALYLLPYDIPGLFGAAEGGLDLYLRQVAAIIGDPMTLLFEGTKTHLWFLVSLAQTTLVVALTIRCCRRRPEVVLAAFSLALFVFGLLSKAYSPTSIGIAIDFNTRNGPFFGAIFFVAGFLMSRLEFGSRHFWIGLASVVVGYLVQSFELYYLYRAHRIPMVDNDYVVGTLFMGLGAAIMAFSNHPVTQIRGLAFIGRYTLGIYGIHVLFVDLLRPLDERLQSPIWEVGYVFVILALSLGVTLVLARNRHLRAVVV